MALDTKFWLADSVIPLWLRNGVDQDGFVEALSMEGAPLAIPRRSMVQARQIYSFRTAIALGCCSKEEGLGAIRLGARALVERYSLASGAFSESSANAAPVLYTQAFALFGLANAYMVLKDPALKKRALDLLEYLERDRLLPSGGYSEFGPNGIVYQSNPHMHLFEAAVQWMEADDHPRWNELAEKILALCLGRFIDRETGFLAEHFNASWSPLREGSRFVFEPGHQYEWSWLMGRFERLTGRDLKKTRQRLFEQSELRGIRRDWGGAYDEVWSDGDPKRLSSRFWPQCERVKAASRLGRAAAADEAMAALCRFFELPVQGLWRDVRLEDGSFPDQPVKASSLYHIIGAIAEHRA